MLISVPALHYRCNSRLLNIMAHKIIRSFHQCQKSKHSRHCWLRRNLLTEAYRCEAPWLDRLKSPVLSQVNISEFSVQVLDKLNKQKNVSLVDMDILANKLHEIESQDEESMVEDILTKFRRTPNAYPVNDAINHAIIRSYIQRDRTQLLLPMLRDKVRFGLFLDPQSACLLMDYFIQKQDFAGAAKVGYEVMLQDDFSHPTSYLLTLYSCVKHLYNSEELPRWEPADIDPEEEVTFIPVDYISIPYYDDHFDILHERLLLGKALYSVGKELGGVVGRSLQLIGLGMWEKFSKANGLVENWLSEVKDEAVVTEESLQRYSDCLSGALTRDPDLPEKGQGEITMDDQIMKLRLTPQEKEDCTTVYQRLQGHLKEANRISSESIETFVENYVKSELPKHENSDIDTLISNYKQWDNTRTELLEKQMREYLVKTKEEEILKKFIELQEKEQLLTFFEQENEVELLGEKATEGLDRLDRDIDEEYVEAPGERDVKKTIKKKKK